MQKVYKVFVTTPKSHTEKVIDAMAKAGAGVVGTYTHCSFVTSGVGSSKPAKESNPYYGEIGKLNKEPEDKIEMVCAKEKLEEVIKAIKSVHPYETPTIDVLEILFFN